MAKGTYIGVNGKARKVKNIYIGVNGVARRVKKAYIGVGGVARPVFGDEIAYYGTTPTSMTGKLYDTPCCEGFGYAVFMGGKDYDLSVRQTDVAFAYNTSLTRTLLTNAPYAAYNQASANVNEQYIVFAYGETSSSAYSWAVAYNTSLTQTQIGKNTMQGYAGGVGCSLGEYGFFICANNNLASGTWNPIERFDSSLTHSYTKSGIWDYTQTDIAMATTPSYLIYGTGKKIGTSTARNSQMGAINKSLTKTALSNYPHYCSGLHCGSAYDKAFFAGGGAKSENYNDIYSYNDTLTRSAGGTMENLPLTYKILRNMQNTLYFINYQYKRESGVTNETITPETKFFKLNSSGVIETEPTAAFSGDTAIQCFSPSPCQVGNYLLLAGGYTFDETTGEDVYVNTIQVYQT